MKKNNLILASIVMIVFSIIAKISGFLREMTFAYYYGASNVTDAYVTASTISISIFSGLTLAVSTGYIPSISSYKKNELSKITSNIINITVLIIIFISIIGVLFIDRIIPFYAIDFSEETRFITQQIASIILPFSFLYVTYNIFNSYMQFSNVFWSVGVATIINNFVNMLAFAFSKGNVEILAFGYALSWVLPTIFLFIVAKFYDYKHSFIINSKDEVFKNILHLGIPIFLGQLIFQFNAIVDKNFASTLGEGVMTIMKYANQLILFVLAIFVTSIVTAIYPTLAKLVANKNLDEYKKLSNTSLVVILLFVFPVSVAFFTLAQEIVEIAFLRGEFNAENAKITSQALMAYSIGLPAISVNEVLNKQFFSLKDTKTPVLANAISLIANIVLNFALINSLKHIGLALATSLANTILATILYFLLKKKIGTLDGLNFVKTSAKMLASSIIMGIFISLILPFIESYTYSLGNIGNIIEICICAIIGAPIYFILVYLFRVHELQIAINFLKEKIKKA